MLFWMASNEISSFHSSKNSKILCCWSLMRLYSGEREKNLKKTRPNGKEARRKWRHKKQLPRMMCGQRLFFVVVAVSLHVFNMRAPAHRIYCHFGALEMKEPFCVLIAKKNIQIFYGHRESF